MYLTELAGHWLTLLEEGSPRSVLVIGEPGGGQVAMGTTLDSQARERGAVVVPIHCLAGAPPMMTTAQLGAKLGLGAEGLDDPADAVGRIRSRLRLRTGSRFVLIVTDAQELPPEDISVFVNLALTPSNSEVFTAMLASTAKADGSKWQASSATSDAFERERRAEVHRLTPATMAEATQILEECVGEANSTPRCVRELLERCDSRLDDVISLASAISTLPQRQRQEVLTGSRALEAVPLPPSIQARVERWIEGFEESHISVARALAVYGSWLSVEGAQALVEPGQDAESCLDDLEAHGIVVARQGASGSPEFCIADALVAQVVHHAIPTLTHRRLHEHAAMLLERVGARSHQEVVALAQHYVDGGLELSDSRIGRIEEAARVLIARSRYASARELLNHLVSHLDVAEGDAKNPARHGRIAVMLAETLSRSGEWREAEAVLSQAVHGGAAAAPAAEVILRRARDCSAQGRPREAQELLEALVDRAQEPDPRLTIQAQVELAYVFQALGRPAEAARQNDLAFETAERAGEWRLAAQARASRVQLLLTRGRASEALAHGRQALRNASRCGEPGMRARAVIGIGNALCDATTVPRGTRWLRRGIRHAERADDYAAFSYGSIRLASALMESGEWDRAEETVRHVVSLNATLHRPHELLRARSLLDLIRAVRGGHVPQLEAELETATPQMGAAARAATGELVAAYESTRLQDRQGAFELLDGAIEDMYGLAGVERVLVADLLPRQVDAALDAGFSEEAQRACDRLATLERGMHGEFPLSTWELSRAQGMIALWHDRRDEAIGQLEAVVESYAAAGYHWRAARTLRVLALAHEQCGNREAALQALVVAHDFYQATDAAEKSTLRAQFSRLGSRPPVRRDSPLTAREIEVVRAACSGSTDAQIGVLLGIRRRTVTTHMQNIFAKLGIHSRRQLPGAARRSGIALADIHAPANPLPISR